MRTCVIWGLNSIKRAVVERGGVVESLRKIFFDNFDQFRSVTRLRDNAMSFDATTVSRFFSRDKRGHENDRDAVQHPVGFDLCRHFSAVGFGHDQIEKNEIGVEDDKQRLVSRTCASSAALRRSAVLAIINTSAKIKNKSEKKH